MELKKFLSETDIKRLINFILRYIADLDIPVKRYVIQKVSYHLWTYNNGGVVELSSSSVQECWMFPQLGEIAVMKNV